MENTVSVRLQNKHDSTTRWETYQTTFKPLPGELIIYDKDGEHTQSKIKIGDGYNTVGNLPFSIGTDIILDATSGDKFITFMKNASGSEYRYVYASGITSLTLTTSTVESYSPYEVAYFTIMFISNASGTTITNGLDACFTGDDCINGVFNPMPNKEYDVGIWWNGVSWQATVRGT